MPEADSCDARAFHPRGSKRFAGYVRDVDYAAARPLFHPDILAFGTHRDIISGLATWQATQWDNVWPKTSDFRFDTDTARVLVVGRQHDGDRGRAVDQHRLCTRTASTFDRPGRATMVFHKQDGAWLCTHSHMSLNRGVPQQSFANRPVKAK